MTLPLRPWLELADDFALRHAIGASSQEILRAFGAEESHEVQGTCFETVESGLANAFNDVSRQIVESLSQEVDQDQAENFARRFEGVVALAHRLSSQSPTGRLFRFGLFHRMREILAQPKNLALRVRAVVDFYYSHISVALHRLATPVDKAISLTNLLPQTKWSPITDTIHRGHLAGMTHNGPVNINFLKVTRPNLEMLHCSKHCPSASDFVDVVRSRNAVAGVSGGFFLYSEPDILAPSQRTDPVGLLIHQGTVENLPIFNRASLIQLDSGQTHLCRVGMIGTTFTLNDTQYCVQAHNAPHLISSCNVSFNRAFGSHAPPHAGVTLVIEANQLLRTTSGLDCPAIPLAGCAITIAHCAPSSLKASHFALQRKNFPFGESTIAQAMAGGPLLVINGKIDIHRDQEDFVQTAPPITFSQDETFDQNLLPRMAVGELNDGNLLFAAIDGRNIERAVGLTLEQTAGLMQAMGCHQAMNLDGGSSKRMVIGDRAVDLASTEVQTNKEASQKVRPVYSAILVHP